MFLHACDICMSRYLHVSISACLDICHFELGSAIVLAVKIGYLNYVRAPDSLPDTVMTGKTVQKLNSADSFQRFRC